MFDSFRHLVRTGFAIIFANLCGFPIAEEKGAVLKFKIIRKLVLCPRFKTGTDHGMDFAACPYGVPIQAKLLLAHEDLTP